MKSQFASGPFKFQSATKEIIKNMIQSKGTPMKKAISTSISMFAALALILIAAQPAAAAAGFIVSTAQATRSGTVVVYLEYSSTPYYAVTTTFSQGIGYFTACGPSGSGFLKCTINGQLAKHHANQTAYIIMNGTEDNKAYFIVPEVPEKPSRGCGQECCPECDD